MPGRERGSRRSRCAEPQSDKVNPYVAILEACRCVPDPLRFRIIAISEGFSLIGFLVRMLLRVSSRPPPLNTPRHPTDTSLMIRTSRWAGADLAQRPGCRRRRRAAGPSAAGIPGRRQRGGAGRLAGAAQAGRSDASGRRRAGKRIEAPPFKAVAYRSLFLVRERLGGRSTPGQRRRYARYTMVRSAAVLPARQSEFDRVIFVSQSTDEEDFSAQLNSIKTPQVR